MHIIGAWSCCAAGAAACIPVSAASGHVVGGYVARKICHAITGLVFLLTWPLFPDSGRASALAAASVVAVATAQFLLVGLGVVADRRLVNNIGGGDRRNLLAGPLQYGVAIAGLTLAHFRTPLAVIVVCVLCGGDASAAVVGKAVGRHRVFPRAHPKTYEGMAAFVAGSFLGAGAVTQAFRYMLQDDAWALTNMWRPTLLACVVGSVAEVLPSHVNHDNVSVPLAAYVALVCAAKLMPAGASLLHRS